MRSPIRLVPALLLALAACGKGGEAPPPPPPPPAPLAALATGLGYVNPAAAGWRLVKDASSTPTRLVLNLVGPSGLYSRGAGFNLQAPASVRFGGFAPNNLPLKAGGVYELRQVVGSLGYPIEPVLLGGGVKDGNLLTVGAFQKDRHASAKDSGATLFQVAIEFDAAGGLRVGDAVPLRITKSKYMAEDIGLYAQDPTAEMRTKAVLRDMTIALGSLTAI